MLRTFRKLIALIGIAAVLFSQLAVTAHACPMMSMAGGGEMNMAVNSEATDELKIDQPALCQMHCQNDQQNFGDLPSPLGSVALAPSFVVTLADALSYLVAAPAATTALLHATAPPLAIRNCCFRI